MCSLPILLATALAVLPSAQVPTAGSGFLGVFLGADSEPAAVNGVVPGSPAAEAGFQAGDRIVAFAGEDIETTGALRERLTASSPGTRVELTVKRGEKTLKIVATLADRDAPAVPAPITKRALSPPQRPIPTPPAELVPRVEAPQGLTIIQEGSDRPFLGVSLMDSETGEGEAGAIISEVIDGSAAAKAKLQSGDVIVQLGKMKISGVEDLVNALQKQKAGDRVMVVVKRDGKNRRVRVRLGKRTGIELPEEGLVVDAPRFEVQARDGRKVLLLPHAKADTETVVEEPMIRDEAEEEDGEEQEGDRPFLGVYLGEGDEGALVDEVIDGTPAAKAGLQGGDVIVRVNRTRIADGDSLVEALASRKPGDKLILRVLRDGKPKRLETILGRRSEEDEEEAEEEEEGEEEEFEEVEPEGHDVTMFKVRPGRNHGEVTKRLEAELKRKVGDAREKAAGVRHKIVAIQKKRAAAKKNRREQIFELHGLEKGEHPEGIIVLEAEGNGHGDKPQVIEFPDGKMILEALQGAHGELTITVDGKTHHIAIPAKKGNQAKRRVMVRMKAGDDDESECEFSDKSEGCENGCHATDDDGDVGIREWRDGNNQYRVIMRRMMQNRMKQNRSRHGHNRRAQAPHPPHGFPFGGQMRPGVPGMGPGAQPMPGPGMWIWVPFGQMGMMPHTGGMPGMMGRRGHPGMRMQDNDNCCGGCGGDEDDDDDGECRGDDDDEGECCGDDEAEVSFDFAPDFGTNHVTTVRTDGPDQHQMMIWVQDKDGGPQLLHFDRERSAWMGGKSDDDDCRVIDVEVESDAPHWFHRGSDDDGEEEEKEEEVDDNDDVGLFRMLDGVAPTWVSFPPTQYVAPLFVPAPPQRPVVKKSKSRFI